MCDDQGDDKNRNNRNRNMQKGSREGRNWISEGPSSRMKENRDNTDDEWKRKMVNRMNKQSDENDNDDEEDRAGGQQSRMPK